MYKYLIFLAVSGVLGFLAYFYYEKSESYCEMWKNSQANVSFLLEQRRKDNEATLAIYRRNQELEQAVAEDKDFDWYRDISNSAVIKRLQAN